jgi:hypothetical protein
MRQLLPLWLILLAMGAVAIYADCTRPPHPGYLITSKYGTMYCRSYLVGNCGVNLSECTDEREYRCLQDVTVKVAE